SRGALDGALARRRLARRARLRRWIRRARRGAWLESGSLAGRGGAQMGEPVEGLARVRRRPPEVAPGPLEPVALQLPEETCRAERRQPVGRHPALTVVDRHDALD